MSYRHQFTRRSVLTFLFLVAALVARPAQSRVLEVNDLEATLTLAQDEGDEHGSERVLVVFDIDNTLLAGRQNFGSDQWYDWQSDLIQSQEFDDAVARDIGGLLKVQSLLYSLSSMRPTQSDTAAIVRTLQQHGHGLMALTARGPVNRDATLRELGNNGIDFEDSSPLAGVSGRFLPVDPTQPGAYGLTPEEVVNFRLNSPRRISFEHGVMMVAGQHKGAMLRTVIHKMAQKPRAVIFVDDKLKNVTDVDTALATLGIEVYALRYAGEDENVAEFHAGDKSISVAAWEALSRTLHLVFSR